MPVTFLYFPTPRHFCSAPDLLTQWWLSWLSHLPIEQMPHNSASSKVYIHLQMCPFPLRFITYAGCTKVLSASYATTVTQNPAFNRQTQLCKLF